MQFTDRRIDLEKWKEASKTLIIGRLNYYAVRRRSAKSTILGTTPLIERCAAAS